ncbi:MAG: DUF11 domain-containing protein [Xanthomonadaceae bacterium]|jgi:hypothetical protein|nr:DUF11 domain-containing protein [Xanthomonadaceae bacterium]
MVRPRPLRRHAVAVLIVATLAAAAPTAAKSPARSKPVAVPVDTSPLEFQGREDHVVKLELDGKPGAVVAPPTHGTLLLDETPVLYVPHPDFNGVDSFVLEEGGQSREVLVKIMPINDPPAFVGGGDRSHVAAGPAAFEVAGWASGITAGPNEESMAQSIRFEVEPMPFRNPSVATIAIDTDGTLRYALTGRPGISEFQVRAIDNGGAWSGGIDRSAPVVLRIGVNAVADLSVLLHRGTGRELPGRADYQLVVANDGPSDALGVLVNEVLPPDAGITTWRCVGSHDGTCPKGDAGKGEIAALLDLPAGATVVFDVRGMRAPPGSGLHAVFVTPPQFVVDPDLSNNEAVD